MGVASAEHHQFSLWKLSIHSRSMAVESLRLQPALSTRVPREQSHLPPLPTNQPDNAGGG